MPENDISKMKVADLKRELKLRGLVTTGNKTELQERLQTALIDGDLSLEDTAISGEDILEDVLTDEEEKEILTLPPDENELLKSPSSELALSFPTDKSNEVPAPQPKKIVLKRKSSITPITLESPSTTTTVNDDLDASIDENGSESKISKVDAKPNIVKVSALTLEERLQMRAKKFGLEENKLCSSNTNSISSVSAAAVVAGKEVDPKQIETLKKRAERFGCVVAPVIAEITANERLEKRKQRFGDVSADSVDKVTIQGKDAYADKARQRLERFKTAAK